MTAVTVDIANLKINFHETVEEAVSYADSNDLIAVGRPEDLKVLTGPQLVSLYNVLCDELNAGSGMGLVHVKRFSSADVGIKRIVKSMADLHELKKGEKPEGVPAGAKELKSSKSKTIKTTTIKPTPKKTSRRSKGVNLEPAERAVPCREGTKQARMVDILWIGASMPELLRVLAEGGKPWQEVTVRSGLNWDMNKLKGYGIRTTFANAFERWLETDFDSSGALEIPAGIGGHPDDCSEEDKVAILKHNVDKGFDPEKRDIAVYHLVLPAGLDYPLPHTPRKNK